MGERAKSTLHSNPKNTVFDAKRLIGRPMDDPNLKHDMKHWPFKINNKSGKPIIQVQHKGEQRDFVSLAATRTFCGVSDPICSDSRGNFCYGPYQDEGDR